MLFMKIYHQIQRYQIRTIFFFSCFSLCYVLARQVFWFNKDVYFLIIFHLRFRTNKFFFCTILSPIPHNKRF
jgi:hypothetical protein